jgi:hypothetical protein
MHNQPIRVGINGAMGTNEVQYRPARNDRLAVKYHLAETTHRMEDHLVSKAPA